MKTYFESDETLIVFDKVANVQTCGRKIDIYMAGSGGYHINMKDEEAKSFLKEYKQYLNKDAATEDAVAHLSSWHDRGQLDYITAQIRPDGLTEVEDMMYSYGVMIAASYAKVKEMAQARQDRVAQAKTWYEVGYKNYSHGLPKPEHMSEENAQMYDYGVRQAAADTRLGPKYMPRILPPM